MKLMNMRTAVIVVMASTAGCTSHATTVREVSSTMQSQPGAPKDDHLQARLEEVDQRIAKLVDVRAEFAQTKRTAMLKKPLVSEGVLLVKGDRVRWDTKKPRPSTMIIGGDEIRIYYPEASVVEVYAATGDVRELTGSPLPRLAVLRHQFDIAGVDAKTLGAGANDPVIAIELTPRSSELKKHVKSVQALINTDIPAATKLIVTDSDGDRTEIEFKNVRVNTDVKEEELELRVPPDTRISRPARDGSSSRPAATLPEQERGR